MSIATVLIALAAGWALWTFAEYLLHRFAMHHLHGKGIMSREHLEHHVTSSWHFDRNHILSWTGMLLVGAVLWAPVGAWAVSLTFGVALAVGWAFGYFFYEYQHMAAHLRGPRNTYEQVVRAHHFHHHFGHPMANHGVTIPFWDHVFGTYERPEKVRVPRRMALPWMVDADGEMKAEFSSRYELVGNGRVDERTAALDRARAFASQAPAD